MNKISCFVFLISFLFALCGCSSKKKYYYVQGDKEELIEESSDSAAYLAAYTNITIAKKVYNDMDEAYGNIMIEKPINFKLLNEKREDITYQVFFENKDSLESSIDKSINEQPNSLKETVNKSREEKHGTGAKYDTGGLYLAPVKVLSAKFISKEYSNYKDVALRFKNVSGKTISAIRFRWYGENAFNEPADMTGLIDGWGGGFTDDALRPGASDYAEWSILSRDGKKVLIAYPYEVAFKDGSKWELEK